MYPIVEQNAHGGVDHNLEDFLTYFVNICYRHLRTRRAKAFAFILFDFHHEAIRDVLNDRSALMQLDRLSGKKISAFYLDSENPYSYEPFNEFCERVLGLQEGYQRPLLVFF